MTILFVMWILYTRLGSRSWGVDVYGKNGLYFLVEEVVEVGNIFEDNSIIWRSETEEDC